MEIQQKCELLRTSQEILSIIDWLVSILNFGLNL